MMNKLKSKNFNIGSNITLGKNWINIDNSPIIILKNFLSIDKKLKFGNIVNKQLCSSNEADNIYLSHVLEHLTFEDADKALLNIYKMLKKGGFLRIVVPSLKSRINLYLKNNDGDELLGSLGICLKSESNFLKKMRFYFGLSRHKWMYDEISLKKKLIKSGFSNLRLCSFGDSKRNIFKEIENKDRFLEKNGSLPAVAIEAIK